MHNLNGNKFYIDTEHNTRTRVYLQTLKKIKKVLKNVESFVFKTLQFLYENRTHELQTEKPYNSCI